MQRTGSCSWLRQRDELTLAVEQAYPQRIRRRSIVAVGRIELATVPHPLAPLISDGCGWQRRQQRLERKHPCRRGSGLHLLHGRRMVEEELTAARSSKRSQAGAGAEALAELVRKGPHIEPRRTAERDGGILSLEPHEIRSRDAHRKDREQDV